MELQKLSLQWNRLFLTAFLAAYLYIFNEWLFATTKPSHMSGLSFPQQMEILLTLSALLAVISFVLLLFLYLLSLLPLLQPFTNILLHIATLLPAILFAALILVMVDNFTYTMFQFGIVSTEGWFRGLYGLGFLVLIVYSYRRTLTSLEAWSQKNKHPRLASKWILGLMIVVIAISIAFLFLRERTVVAAPILRNMSDVRAHPHILLITSDGVDATHMSLYGYKRETTPNMRQLAESSLLAENAFSNSGNSPGSVISMYTGKYPTDTRVLFPPDILKESDSYEHLPGLLRAQGYKTVQITVPHYLDADTFNILDGFDEVRLSSAEHSEYLDLILEALPSDHALFADEILTRILDRSRHIFFIRTMINPYIAVTGKTESIDDIERMEGLKQALFSSNQPVFVHVHLMVTHGPKFNPQVQVFSVGQSVDAQEEWGDDFFDDSILDFDRNIGRLVEALTERDLLDDTILILGSDHGSQWDPLKRLPLLIRFPHGEHAGRIRASVQNLDIAPTLLDYLGLEQPYWMRGTSLIAGELAQRPILGATAPEDKNPWEINWEDVDPPFYQFGSINVNYCQTWYRLDLTTLAWDSGAIEGYSSPCSPDLNMTEEQAYQGIVEHLRANGFDVSTLETIQPWRE